MKRWENKLRSHSAEHGDLLLLKFGDSKNMDEHIDIQYRSFFAHSEMEMCKNMHVLT